MNLSRKLLCLALLFSFSPAAHHRMIAPVSSTQSAADLILYRGVVWTVDEAKPQAEAIAVRGDKIIKVGGNAEVLALKGDRTQVIDLKFQQRLAGRVGFDLSDQSDLRVACGGDPANRRADSG